MGGGRKDPTIRGDESGEDVVRGQTFGSISLVEFGRCGVHDVSVPLTALEDPKLSIVVRMDELEVVHVGGLASTPARRADVDYSLLERTRLGEEVR